MEIFRTENTVVIAIDEPDNKIGGGAHHKYVVRDNDGRILVGPIVFQQGPIGESGVNGLQHVDLLAMVRHRLDSFQRGPLASPINEVTCGYVSAAIASEETRTRRRKAVCAEGKSQRAIGVEE